MDKFKCLGKNEIHDPNTSITLQKDYREMILINILFEIFSLLIVLGYDLSLWLSLIHFI